MSAYVLFFGGFSGNPKGRQPLGCKRQFTNAWRDIRQLRVAGGGAQLRRQERRCRVQPGGSLKQAIETIEQCATDWVYIVGHSSGCAIAREVDKGLKDTSKVVLVALDGFAPYPGQMARQTTQVWAAVCDDKVSRNHDRLKEIVGGRLKIYKATNCYGKSALHFSVVNSAANDKSVTNIPTGYTNCRANLMWMPSQTGG